MSTDKLFIPSKLRVGFQERGDTYTGKLAYVIYYDNAGKIRKETSWKSWCDAEIEPLELDNIPTEGFVLNKNVGGARQSWGWNVRNEYVRVYDPRNFEFEISIPNLLFILRECDCSRGKGLEGKFVYSWDGQNLVLLPVSSVDYQESQTFTGMQSKSIPLRSMTPGLIYMTKQMVKLVYLGRFNYYYSSTWYENRKAKVQDQGFENRLVFCDEETSGFVYLKDTKKLGIQVTTDSHPNYAELVEKYNQSAHGSKPVKLLLDKIDKNRTFQSGHYKNWGIEIAPGEFVSCYGNTNESPNNQTYVQYSEMYKIDNGVLKITEVPRHLKSNVRHSVFGYRQEQVTNATSANQYNGMSIFVELENGGRFRVSELRKEGCG